VSGYDAVELRVLLRRWERGSVLGPSEMQALLEWDETPKDEHAELRVLIEEHRGAVEPGEEHSVWNRLPKNLTGPLQERLRSVLVHRTNLSDSRLPAGESATNSRLAQSGQNPRSSPQPSDW
jgi:hypothetical protein